MSASKRLKIADPEREGLSASQAAAFDLVISGQSVFITGSGGVGKTELIKRIYAWHDRCGLKIQVTATTGIAAVNVEGRTVHSFVRMTPDDDQLPIEDVITRLKRETSKAWRADITNLKTLVIDEVSMMQPQFFDRLDTFFRVMRSTGSKDDTLLKVPFGGVQVILVGDFFQLPPVSKERLSDAKRFIFETKTFWDTVKHVVELTEVFRQTDAVFVGLLQRMRLAKLTPEDVKILQDRVNADVSHVGVEPTMLYAKNADVDRINAERLSQIQKPKAAFVHRKGTFDIGSTVPDASVKTQVLDKFIKDQNIATTMELKEGAQVMLTFNLDVETGLANGSRGVIIGFKKPDSCDSEKAFEVRKPEEPLLYADEAMPVVRFLTGFTPEGTPVTRTIMVPYTRWGRKDIAKRVEAFVWQVPLKLGWATTIHKSQGLSLTCVKAALDQSVFEEGQAYVAVSRARSLQGLTLTEFKPEVIRANTRVVDFTLMSVPDLRVKYG